MILSENVEARDPHWTFGSGLALDQAAELSIAERLKGIEALSTEIAGRIENAASTLFGARPAANGAPKEPSIHCVERHLEKIEEILSGALASAQRLVRIG